MGTSQQVEHRKAWIQRQTGANPPSSFVVRQSPTHEAGHTRIQDQGLSPRPSRVRRTLSFLPAVLPPWRVMTLTDHPASRVPPVRIKKSILKKFVDDTTH